jgi:hypothetical protein
MYLLSDGHIVNDLAESIMDFLKLNLSVPSGSFFNLPKYGVVYFEPSNKESVLRQLQSFIENFRLNLTIESIDYIKDKCVTITFVGQANQLIVELGA